MPVKGQMVVHRKRTGRRVELVVDGEAVSGVELPYRRLRVGRAVLTAGGLGDVFTKRAHRMKGHSRRVLEHALTVMTDDRLDVSLLFGIPNFYPKFGYRAALSDYRVELPGRGVIDLPQTLRPRRLPTGRHREILPLYRRDLRRRGFGIERPASWATFRRGVRGRDVQVTGFYRGRRLAGYVLCDDDAREVRVAELAADGREGTRAILGWLGRQCRRKVCESVQLVLPPDHPASRAAVAFGAVFTRKTHANGGGMMRILNLGGTLSALMPELVARWAASPLADRGLDLVMRTDLGPAEVVVPARAAGAETLRGTVRMTQGRLIQLVTGYLSVADLAEADDVAIPRRLIRPLRVLFPRGDPTILCTNCF